MTRLSVIASTEHTDILTQRIAGGGLPRRRTRPGPQELSMVQAVAYAAEWAAAHATYDVGRRNILRAVERGSLRATRYVMPGQPRPMVFVRKADLEAYLLGRPQKSKPGGPEGRRT